VNDRNKIIDKIRKCLALSKSANENEAAAALRQAQKLMQAYNVTEEDVGLASYTESFVDHNYPWRWTRVTKKDPVRKPRVVDTLATVSDLVAHAFTVKAVWDRSPRDMFRVWYFGRHANVALACYAHEVVYKAAMAAWRAYRKTDPSAQRMKGGRTSFFRAWCYAVKEKVEDLAPKDEEKAAIEKRVAKSMGSTTIAENSKLQGHRGAMAAGLAAGAQFDINRPVGTERNRLEKL
jgi:hypothetical protein